MDASSHVAGVGLVVYAKDKERVAAFYAQALDLVEVEGAEAYVVLRRGDVEVVVLRIPDGIASGFEITDPPAVREDTPLKPVFYVRSLVPVREAAAATGGYLKPPEAEWQFRGTTVVDGWDPEGNVVQFRQDED